MKEVFLEYIMIGVSPLAPTQELMISFTPIIFSLSFKRGTLTLNYLLIGDLVDVQILVCLFFVRSVDNVFGIFCRCKLEPVLAEVDRIVRPGGKLIVRDESRAIGEVENLLKSLHWEVRLTFSKNQEGILSAQKGDWRPKTFVELA